jgi:hypothetical protein
VTRGARSAVERGTQPRGRPDAADQALFLGAILALAAWALLGTNADDILAGVVGSLPSSAASCST